MARNTTRRRQSRRSAQLDFAALEITGGLLPTEVVSLIAAGDAGEQDSESYGILKGLKLRDEIARFYQIGLAHWDTFEMNRAGNKSAPISFVQSLLRDCFGFNTLEKSSGKIFEGRSFPVNFAAEGGRIPVIVSPLASEESNRLGIDEALDQFGDGSRKRSATQLLQEYLNADDDALWGIVTDGSVLRIMRDNASLTRPAWIEINFEKIFQDGLFPDFSATWLILHASRFGTSGTNPSDCSLERWKEKSRLDGAAAKENLRLGVEAALLELGTGFLNHPANEALRDALKTGELKGQNYYEELLRLIYRLIFLFAAEDRNLLHAPNTPNTVRKAYLGGYSLDRLRDRCTRNGSLDQNVDAWEGMKALFEALNSGQAALGLTALGGLFETEKLNNLNKLKIQNKSFLKAVWYLSWFRPEGEAMTKVNWRDMETEELGSVYESLLELTPRVNLEGRKFSFAEGDETRGNARKTTGSYYTPDSLVKLLLDTTLDPVLDAAEARNPTDPVSEILKLSIIDPACGSGHFLLGAARRTAARVARHRMPGAISKEVFQHALREVVGNCIYGSDRNPMAVELCKVALWIEALEPGKPLSFLDARIQCGDSLIGVFDYEMLTAGIPDEAYKALSGDDSAVAAAYKRLNKDERDGRAATGFIKAFAAPTEIVDEARKIAAMPEDTLSEVKAKARAFAKYEGSDKRKSLKLACDMYVSAFFTKKIGDEPSAYTLKDMPVPTTGAMWEALSGKVRSDILVESSIEVSKKNSALHWPLSFPSVMSKGGFDVVVGNPPWEQIQLDPGEWFASRDTRVTTAPNMAAKNRVIEKIKVENPVLYAEYMEAKRDMESIQSFIHKSGRFPTSSVGRLNTAPCFVELSLDLTPNKYAGVIAPTGIATDSFTQQLFQKIVNENRLTALIGFNNKKKLFPDVGSMITFAIFAFGPCKSPIFSFLLEDIDMFSQQERRYSLTTDEIRRINPNTLTAPIFRSKADAELTARTYNNFPVLIEERKSHPEGDKNPWNINFQLMFMMNTDSVLFCGEEELSKQSFMRNGSTWEHSDGRRYVPLYEAKMIHHYDHRWATYEGLGNEQATRDVALIEKRNPNFEPTPRYWVPEEEVDLRASRVPSRLKSAFRKDDADGCLKILAEWVLGSTPGISAHNPVASLREIQEHVTSVLGSRATSPSVVGRSMQSWLKDAAPRGLDMQRFTPLSYDDYEFMKDCRGRWLELTGALIDRKTPSWTLSWRRNARQTDERTWITNVFPSHGAGDSLFIMRGNEHQPKRAAALLAMSSSLFTDYFARQKVGGINLSFFFVEQFPCIIPEAFNEIEYEFLTKSVLELTYTSHALRPWAEDLGYTGSPFKFDPERRAYLRAELDAFFAKKYGLTREETRYVLDPSGVKGADYPSETFRGLKNKEINQFGEYRTQRLVLEAFDKMTGQ